MNSPAESWTFFLPQGWPESNLMIVFGTLLAFGTLGGVLAARLRWLPTITGFMAFGLLIGPNGLELLSATELLGARPLVDIALGLILFKLGAVLHPWLLAHDRTLMTVSLVESGLTFTCIGALMLWMDTPPVVAAIAAAIAVSSSPAVLLHVAEELHAAGPTTDTAEALVAMNNVWAFVLFSLALPMALYDAKFNLSTVLLLPAYQSLGAVVVGCVVAWAVCQIAKRTRPEERHLRFALVVGAVMLSLGLAVAFKVSTLFTALTLGVASRWMQGSSELTKVGFGGGGDVFFIILFVFAGANLHLRDLMDYWPLVLAYVGTRSLAKVLGVYVTSKSFGRRHKQSFATGLLLVPMAGLAIGLVQTTVNLMPELGVRIAAVVLASVAVFETFGPPIAAFALRLSGDAGRAHPGKGAPNDAPAPAPGATGPAGSDPDGSGGTPAAATQQA